MSFSKLTALSIRNDDPQKAIKPFDKHRDGTILGDGAGILILESESHASKRGVPIYAKIRGCANNCEGYSLATPHPSGEKMAAVMKMALKNAQVTPDQIDYLSAHGTATPQNDRAEAAAVHIVFKEHAKKLLVSSQKSMIGHTIGAAGAIELAITAISMSKGVVTPNINYETPDPACDLNIVANKAQESNIRFAASNSFALGGHNSCIILERV
jgi:3-oxoacyl-[acyl-carrier-protein] synthase II